MRDDESMPSLLDRVNFFFFEARVEFMAIRYFSWRLLEKTLWNIIYRES